jgi:predicted nucleic acid-binding protein
VVLLEENNTKVEFDDVQFEIRLSLFQSSGNEEYVLLDTGCVLALLRRFHRLRHRLEKDTLKIAILEINIEEVAEHLSKSQNTLIQKGFPILGIRSAIENLQKILQDDRIRKVANPIIPGKAFLAFEHFQEDKLLAYALSEGKFKAVVTQDKKLLQRLGEHKCIPCDHLWTAQL